MLSKILMRTKLSSLLIIKRKNYRLRFYPSAYSRLLWINNDWENPVLEFVRDYLHAGDNMVDVGANIGVVTLESALSVVPKGKIYSIEPHPRTFNFLKGNIALNHLTNIETFNVALGNDNGSIKISDDQNSIVGENGLSIPVRRLDDLINASDVALLKIDVEGYEKFVLMGATNLLKSTKCVYFEAVEESTRKFDYPIEDVYNILLDNGFKLFRISNKKEISLITRSYRPTELGQSDLLAIKNTDDFLQRTNFKIANNE